MSRQAPAFAGVMDGRTRQRKQRQYPSLLVVGEIGRPSVARSATGGRLLRVSPSLRASALYVPVSSAFSASATSALSAVTYFDHSSRCKPSVAAFTNGPPILM